MNLIGINGYIGSGKDTVGEMILHLTGHDYIFGGEQVRVTDWKIKKYAAKLKQVASLLTGIPAEKFEDQEFKKTNLEPEWGNNKYGAVCKVREFLQRLGTEAIRDGLHYNAWVNALFSEYTKFLGKQKTGEWIPYNAGWIKYENHKKYGFRDEDYIVGKSEEHFSWEYPKWIITDARFPNEANAIKDRGGIVVRVNRTYDTTLRGHMDEVGPASANMLEQARIKHPSETSLDDWQFDYIIENNGTKEELLEKVREMLIKYEII